MCLKYGQLYFENVEQIKETFHRDRGQIFVLNLSPSFLGIPDHLDQFRQILDRAVLKNKDSHFIKLLTNEIEKMENIIAV